MADVWPGIGRRHLFAGPSQVRRWTLISDGNDLLFDVSCFDDAYNAPDGVVSTLNLVRGRKHSSGDNLVDNHIPRTLTPQRAYSNPPQAYCAMFVVL